MSLEQKEHCVAQVRRFSGMMYGTVVPDRSRDIVLLQLAYNLGRYAELANEDGRMLWKRLEKCSEFDDYSIFVNWNPLSAAL
jgi:hypothetical protein